MNTNTGAHKAVLEALNIDWKQIRHWKDKTLTKEKVAEIIILASTATILGYVVWFVARAADNYKVVGLG